MRILRQGRWGYGIGTHLVLHGRHVPDAAGDAVR